MRMQLINFKAVNQSVIKTQKLIYLLQYIIRPEVVVVPQIEEPTGKKWHIASAVAASLTLIAILSLVLTFQLNKNGMLNFTVSVITHQ